MADSAFVLRKAVASRVWHLIPRDREKRTTVRPINGREGVRYGFVRALCNEPCLSAITPEHIADASSFGSCPYCSALANEDAVRAAG